MQACKAFLKIALKRLPSILPYLIVFMIIAFFMVDSSSEDSGFERKSLDLAVIDIDNTEASRELKKYLLDGNTEVKLRSQDDEYIQDMLYHGMADGVITIEKGFSDKLASGETEGCIESLVIPTTFISEYTNSIVNRYVTAAEMYVSTGSDPAEACRQAAELSQNGAEVELLVKRSPLGDGLASYCQYFAYIIICLIINGLTPILMRFFSTDIRRRIDVSALPLYKKNAAIIAVTGGCVMAVWAIVMGLGEIRYGGLFTERGALCLLNSFVLTVAVTAMALVVSVLCKSTDSVTSIMNILSLGMSFLCGVFVPSDLLGSGVISAARFLPVYWYISANNKICCLAGETYDTSGIFTSIGIECLFAAALFAVFAVLTKNKIKEEN